MSEIKTIAYVPIISSTEETPPFCLAVTIEPWLAELAKRAVSVLESDIGFAALLPFATPENHLVLCSPDGNSAQKVEDSNDIAELMVTSTTLAFDVYLPDKANPVLCGISFDNLAMFLDKAWVEYYGYVFVQLPDSEPGEDDGKWLCVDSRGGANGFYAACDTLNECVEKAVRRAQKAIDRLRSSMPVTMLQPRPRLNLEEPDPIEPVTLH